MGVEKDKYAAAALWFQHAKDEYPIAKIYCDISACLQNIAKYYKSEQYAKLSEEYKTLWSQVSALNADVLEYDEDLQVRAWNEIINMFRNNSTEFCEATSKEEVLTLIDDIEKKSSAINNSFLQSTIAGLQDNIATTRTKIQSVKSDK